MSFHEKMRALLELNEGRRRLMYRDSLGLHTIGIGHLMSRPISDRAVDQIFQDDYDEHAAEMHKAFPWAAELDEVRRGALLDLVFNMGVPRVLQFKNTLAAFQAGNWEATALGLEQSKWFTQVGLRGPRIVGMVRTGVWP